MGSWADFFAAELGAAAALTGLAIVGISINVTRILSDPGLPGRAVETLVTPAGVLIASTYALCRINQTGCWARRSRLRASPCG
jgi:hypothetical protein